MDFNITGNITGNGTDNGTGNGTYPSLPPPNYFGYNPNKEMEIAVFILFAVCTLAVLVQNIWKRTWFMMPLVLGGIIELAAFGAMIYTTHNMDSLDGYIVFLVSVLVAPTVLAAADYSLAGHVMLRGEARVACFTPKVTKYLFLITDIAAFFTQAVGAVIVGSAKTYQEIKNGANIVLVGLAISLCVFVVFLVFSIILRKRVLRNLAKQGEDTRWTRIFWVIYLNMFFLALRALYRVAEFHQKLATPPSNSLSTEGYFYGLDTMLMVVLMLSWTVFHPFRFGMADWQKKDAGIPLTTTDPHKVNIRGV